MKSLIIEKLSTAIKNVNDETQSIVSDITYMLFFSMTPEVDWSVVGGMPIPEIESSLTLAFENLKPKLVMYSEIPSISISSIAKRKSILYINLKFSFTGDVIYKNVSVSI